MKKVVLFSLMLVSFVGYSQSPNEKKDKKPTNTNQIYTAVETQPNYPGGLDNFRKFIAQNYQSPKVDKDIKGKVLVQFVVEEDGSLSDIKVIRDLGYGTGEEAIRVLKLSEKWKPGILDGKPVRVRYTLPIDLNISSKN